MTIFVLGMHRSGTSAITRLIGDMGAYIGPENLLLPAGPDNPHGFWERQDVLAINRAILRAQQCNWYHVEHFSSERALPPGLELPMRRIADELQAHAPFVVKDPRFCLTLPYWRPFFPSLSIVWAERDLHAIADSLHRRNQMPHAQALALCDRYLAQAEQHCAGLPVVRCHFEALLADPHQVITSLYHALSTQVGGLRLPSHHHLVTP